MVYGEGYLMDEAGRVTRRFPATEPFSLWRLVYFGDYILQQTVFWRRSVFDAVGLLDESLHYGMDWDFWIRVAKCFEIAYMPEFLGNLREYATAKTFAGGLERFHELTGVMRRYGTRRYPPAYFNYGWDAYQTALREKIRRDMPWLDRPLFRRLGRLVRRMGANLIFSRLSRLFPPSPYSDGWLSDRAYFLFPSWRGKTHLRIAGSTEHSPGRLLPFTAEVLFNGRCLLRLTLTGKRPFEVEEPLPRGIPDASMLEVALRINRSFVPAGESGTDPRRLTFQLRNLWLA
jgi:hypothetical protein